MARDHGCDCGAGAEAWHRVLTQSLVESIKVNQNICVVTGNAVVLQYKILLVLALQVSLSLSCDIAVGNIHCSWAPVTVMASPKTGYIWGMTKISYSS